MTVATDRYKKSFIQKNHVCIFLEVEKHKAIKTKQINKYTHANTYTCMHTHMRRHMHTHTHTDTHTPNGK